MTLEPLVSAALLAPLITGIVAGLVASIGFFAALRLTRPRVELARAIALEPSGECWYKVHNRARRWVTDLQLDLNLAVPAEDGHTDFYSVPVKGPIRKQLPPYKRSDKAHAYTWQMQLPEDFEAKWDRDTSYIIATVFGRDVMSGTGRIGTARVSEMLSGTFEHGRSNRVQAVEVKSKGTEETAAASTPASEPPHVED